MKVPKKVKRNGKTVPAEERPWSPTPVKATAKIHLVDEEGQGQGKDRRAAKPPEQQVIF